MYPLNLGSHYSIQHLLDNDKRNFTLLGQLKHSINTLPQIDLKKRDEYIKLITYYKVFPNIFPTKIKTMEGISEICESFFKGNINEIAIIKKKL